MNYNDIHEPGFMGIDITGNDFPWKLSGSRGWLLNFRLRAAVGAL